ncbi:hypothetical protein J5681_01030 [bacterium]|nr:hypothetical protein [bacterium]
MKKIYVFMLMIFGAFILFAQEAPKEEPKNEEVKTEAPAEAQSAEQQNAEAQPAETQAQEEQKPAEAETPAQEEQKPDEPETPAEAQPVEPETPAEAPVQTEYAPENAPQQYAGGGSQKIEYYRPYLGAGVPLIVIGSVSFIVMMPAMGTMAFAGSDACEGKDWDFCEELHDNSKKHHTAWTVGSVMTGVVGAGMIAVGSWLTSIEKPRENQCVTLEGVAVLPTKDGMYASIGLGF